MAISANSTLILSRTLRYTGFTPLQHSISETKYLNYWMVFPQQKPTTGNTEKVSLMLNVLLKVNILVIHKVRLHF